MTTKKKKRDPEKLYRYELQIKGSVLDAIDAKAAQMRPVVKGRQLAVHLLTEGSK